MKTETITISKSDVLHQVNLRNYYSGESAKQGDTIEIATKMQTSEDNFDVLNKYVDTACSALVNVLNPVCVDVSFAESSSDSATTLTYTIKVSDLYAESQNDLLKKDMFDYLVNWAIYEWLTLSFPTKAEVFLQKCGILETSIRSHINKRIKPEQR